MIEQKYALADPDYYAPVETVKERGREYSPVKVPDGWDHIDWSVWRSWRRDGQPMPDEGWKVHVSARADRFAAVLDVFADECFGRDIPFKHVTAQLYLLLVQHKHASRTQSGKLLVAYPPDVDAARSLMSALAGRLTEEEGQFILTDRRFGDSKVVHYRYGSFVPRRRLLPDGTALPLVRDGRGELVADRRDPAFHLPEGITDPFLAAAAEGGPGESEPDFHGFAFEYAIRHSNGGGTYVGREMATGRKVFIKEARDHAGLSWDGSNAVERTRREWQTLQALHAAHPGICPEPIAYFREWEHEFLVTEFVEGVTFNKWSVANSALIRAEAEPADCERYFEDCERIISALERQIETLHTAGYIFGDVSPGNVIVDGAARPRLVDFEAAVDIADAKISVATDGYAPPPHLVGDDATIHDAYGLSALVQLLLGPTFAVATRYPRSLTHLLADLEERAPVPPRLWRRAVRYHAPDGPELLPGPEEVAADPEHRVRELRDRVADALIAMADPGHPDRVFPTIPDGYATNTLGVAFGTAGVLHALRRCDVPVDDAIVKRFRTDALAAASTGTMAPGFHVGQAGVAWVLAEFGFLDEARDLLLTAAAHPLLDQSVSFATGAAGVAMTHLAMFEHTGDLDHVDAAQRLLGTAGADQDLTARLGLDEPSGWLHGRAGVAWALLPLGVVTGDDDLIDRGIRLLHHELDRAVDPVSGAVNFLVSAKDRRSMPYLYCGTAGMLRVVARYNRVRPDERLLAVESSLLPRLRTTYTVMAGLYQGIAGLGFALADYGALAGDDSERGAALRTARALFKYAVPGDTGVRFHGEKLKRFSADLWSGSAGILLFLDETVRPRRDRLFSLDRLTATVQGAPTQRGTNQ